MNDAVSTEKDGIVTDAENIVMNGIFIPRRLIFVKDGKLHPSAQFSIHGGYENNLTQVNLSMKMPGWDEPLFLPLGTLGIAAFDNHLHFVSDVLPAIRYARECGIPIDGIGNITRILLTRILSRYISSVHFVNHLLDW